MTSPDRMRLWVVSELYHPEQTSTGYFLTGLAEGLAADASLDVRVLCSQPTYSSRGTLSPVHEVRTGVTIERCPGTRFNKDRIALRLVNLLTITFSLAWRVWRRARAGDVVMVGTNPPTLPFAVAAATRLRGAHLVLRIEDVYPDALVAAGALRRASAAVNLLRALSRELYLRARRVVVLGRDMAALVERTASDSTVRIVSIPHWGAVEEVKPAPRAENALLRQLGLLDRPFFVVQHMGNMGRTHGVDAIARAAARLRERADLRFLFVGWGAGKAALERTIADQHLRGVTVLPPCAMDELPTYANACDLAVIALKPGMSGVSVPSRMYTVMAAGKPIVALADEDSELARVIREEDIGWVVAPDDDAAVARVITEAAAAPPGILAAMGARAREAAVAKYSLPVAVARYREMMHDLQPATT